MKYHIKTYGCQMNVHESEKIAGILVEKGYTETKDQEQADVVIFNTCCIRETAESKILGHIGETKHLKERNPSVIVGICGCMSQQEGAAEKLISRFPHLDFILGTANIGLIKEKIDAKSKNKIVVSSADLTTEGIPVHRTSGTNAWVNIMYGCNNFCTYCIVPYVRGRERSRPFDVIVSEVKELLAEGYKEITLLGQNVNSYGKDFGGERGFAELLDEIGSISGKHRIRFMTSHPKDMSDKIIDIIAKYSNICKYIHLPVQSGSNDILRQMNRRYTREQYFELVDKIRAKIPNVAISSDVMVGFPNETSKDFSDTLDLLERVRFSGLYSFIYSRRKGTPAYLMDGQVELSEKRKRIVVLQELQNNIVNELSKEYAGKVFNVLIEDVNLKYKNTYCGRTDCGRLVNVKSDTNIIGKFIDLRITKHQNTTLWGEIVNDSRSITLK